MNPHTSLAIAQIVFYVPAAILALWLMIRNWAHRPRMAWWPMIPLSLMRLAGGAITIVLEGRSRDLGLIIAALVLLNVGAIPLVVANLGQVRMIMIDSLKDNPIYSRIGRALRISMTCVVVLFSAGGGLVSGQPQIGKWLSFAGYIVLLACLVCLIGLELFFSTKRGSLIPSSRKVLKGSLLAAPFIILRSVYGVLETYFGFFSLWSPLYGNIVAFALMALLCEYIAICIWFYVGFTMAPDRGVRSQAAGGTPLAARQKEIV